MSRKTDNTATATQGVRNSRGFPRILITGVPSVGKTSVALGIRQTIPSVGVCEFGRLMAMIGKQRNILEDYRDLPDLELNDRSNLQIAAAAHVAKLDQAVAIAAHLVVRAPEGYVDGFPEPALSCLQLTGIMMITAEPRQIHSRRSRRAMDLVCEDVAVIQSHQERVWQMAARVAGSAGIPFDHLINHDGELPTIIAKAVHLWQNWDR